jgi:hypothetical protein
MKNLRVHYLRPNAAGKLKLKFQSGIKTFCVLAIETLSSLQIYKATFFIVWKINLETKLVYQKDRCVK